MRRRTGHIGMGAEERQARMTSLGGSDARIIMSGNASAIEQLWREKRGEIEPEDLSDVILINMGNILEDLNADLLEDATGLFVTDEQLKVFHPDWEHAHSTLDGFVRKSLEGEKLGIFEGKFMFPFGFDKDEALQKYYPQVQHNMWVTRTKHAWLSILTGAASHVIIEVDADPFYQVTLESALRDFWDCVVTGRTPGVVEVGIPAAERVKVIDMSKDNEWMAEAHELIRTKTIADRHEASKKAIKKKMPKDAKEAAGGGIKIILSKDGKQLFRIDEEFVAKADNDSGLADLFPPVVKEEKKSKPKPRTKRAAAAETEAA